MIDPITLEVLHEAFVSTVREMRVTLVRTAYSSILYEGEDFSCVLMDGDAQIVAMSKGQDHPLHIVPIGWSMKAVLDKFGDDIHPGDIFLHNDPYTGGTHLNDVAMIYPLFTPDGSPLVSPVVRAHWGDVGGMSPGSLSGGATRPSRRAFASRRSASSIADGPTRRSWICFFANMRGPRERQGDYQAMIGTCRKAAERIEALAARYGAATVLAAVAELMDRAEARMRRAIGALPQRRVSVRGPSRERHAAARAAHRPRSIGRSATMRSPWISRGRPHRPPARPTSARPWRRPAPSRSSRPFSTREPTSTPAPTRPLTVIAPPGTIVNAHPPAPCGGMVEVKYSVETAVMGALAQALEGKVTGDLKGGANHCYVGGPDPRSGATFIFYNIRRAARGRSTAAMATTACARPSESDMTTLQPIEAVEQLYPLLVERTTLREDSGGPGQWRGGLGLTREVRIRASRRPALRAGREGRVAALRGLRRRRRGHQPVLGPAERARLSSPRPCPAR